MTDIELFYKTGYVDLPFEWQNEATRMLMKCNKLFACNPEFPARWYDGMWHELVFPDLAIK